MSLAFLAKKTWHTSNLKNVEKVWIAEQKHAAEQQRLNDLKKQIEEERQVQELRELQASQGNKSAVVQKVDWMYDGPMASHAESTEEYLLGKKYSGSKDPDDDPSKISNQSTAIAAHFQAPKPPSANEAFTRLHEDPLLAIKKKQQEARNHVLKNPRKMQMLEAQIASEKARRKDKKKEKKEKKKDKKAEKKARKKERKEGSRPSHDEDRNDVAHNDQQKAAESSYPDRRREEMSDRSANGQDRHRSRSRDRGEDRGRGRDRSRSRERGRDRSRSRDGNRSRGRSRSRSRDRQARERGRGERGRPGERGRDDRRGREDRSGERGGRGVGDHRRDDRARDDDGRSGGRPANSVADQNQGGLIDAASATSGGLIKPGKPPVKDGAAVAWSGASRPANFGLQPTKYEEKRKGSGLGPDDVMLAKRQKYLESLEKPDPNAIRREANKRGAKMTAEEKAAKIAAMSQDADVHDELRTQRFSKETALSKAPEQDMSGTNPLFLSKLGQDSFADNTGVDALEKRVKQQRHYQQKGNDGGFHRR
jgi:hypothetical protein